MISLSHSGMISLMDNIAEGHDEEILEWQDEFSQMLCTESNNLSNSEVYIYIHDYVLQAACNIAMRGKLNISLYLVTLLS